MTRGKHAIRAANRLARTDNEIIQSQKAKISRLKAENFLIRSELQELRDHINREIFRRVSKALHENGFWEVVDMHRNFSLAYVGVTNRAWYYEYLTMCGSLDMTAAAAKRVWKAMSNKANELDPNT